VSGACESVVTYLRNRPNGNKPESCPIISTYLPEPSHPLSRNEGLKTTDVYGKVYKEAGEALKKGFSCLSMVSKERRLGEKSFGSPLFQQQEQVKFFFS